MTTNQPPDRCDECGARRRIHWRLVEVFPDRTYTKFCRCCAEASDADFTPLGAVQQASAIVKLQYVLAFQVKGRAAE